MLAKERHDEIVRLVNENGSVLVKDLAKQFSVTEDSIRKDLTLLQKNGFLKKTYGGAVKVKVNEQDFFIEKRKGKHTAEKMEIARKAAQLIADGDMIFLDNSTSNIELAKILIQEERNVKVVTSMIDILLLFKKPCVPKFIFIGGMMNDEKETFVGALTNEIIRQYHFDKAFIGVVSVDLEKNRVSTYEPEDGLTKAMAMEHASESYLMLETRKFDMESNYQFARIDDFTGAISEQKTKSLEKQLEKYSIEWI